MTSIILGTAGHIDHGKTALIRALTGIDTDRLEEEKRRGISIDIGFAHLDLGEVRLGFVDVPGHERFVKNMLAGVGGIDAVILVIAADESIKPQTREHFDICRLLGIRHGLVALTKADLVDAARLDAVHRQVERFVAGSFLEGAPIIPVSATTHDGLAQLREALRPLAAACPTRDTSRHFRLPIDRSFTMRGFGTVVTGTVIAGAVGVEEEVELHPGGRRLRVRGIQTHNRAVKRATAGQRAALNLTGADAAELTRGQVLAEPGRFHATTDIGCSLHLLPSAAALKHGAPVHFHAGTAEVEGRVRLVESLEPLAPGATANLCIRLEQPLLLLPGDRFILRRFSPVITIGGGTVLDCAPPRLRRTAMAARLAALAAADPSGRAAILLGDAPHGMSQDTVIARTGLLAAETARAGVLLRVPEPWLIGRPQLAGLIERLENTVTTFHKANPLLPGVPLAALRAALTPDAPTGLLEALLDSVPALVREGDTLRHSTHQVSLNTEEAGALAAIEQRFRDAALAPPALTALLNGTGVDARRARSLTEMLLRQKRLVRISADLIVHTTALEGLEQLLAVHRGETFSIATFRAWTGLSRKYAVPVLEFLDRRRVTRRQGDQRQVLPA